MELRRSRTIGGQMIPQISKNKYSDHETDRTEIPYSSEETVEPSQAEVDAAIDEYLNEIGLGVSE